METCPVALFSTIINKSLHSRWRIVVHGGIDGFSRIPVYLHASPDNQAATVLNLFTNAVNTFGLPSREILAVFSDYQKLETICNTILLSIDALKFALGIDACVNKTKQMYHSSLNLKVICFSVLISQAWSQLQCMIC